MATPSWPSSAATVEPSPAEIQPTVYQPTTGSSRGPEPSAKIVTGIPCSPPRKLMSPPVIARRTECPGSNRCTISRHRHRHRLRRITDAYGRDESIDQRGSSVRSHVVEFREHHRLSGRRNTQRHSGGSHHVHSLGHRRSGPERLGSRNLCIRNVSGRIDIEWLYARRQPSRCGDDRLRTRYHRRAVR